MPRQAKPCRAASRLPCQAKPSQAGPRQARPSQAQPRLQNQSTSSGSKTFSFSSDCGNCNAVSPIASNILWNSSY